MSSVASKSRHTSKWCSICGGETAGSNWARHWKRQHPNLPRSEWKALKENEDPAVPQF